MRFPAIGASYSLPAIRADCQRCVNYYPEVVESTAGKNSLLLKRTPGISVFSTVAGSDGPVRGIFAGENRLFVVAGSALYEVFSNGTFANRSILPGATLLADDGQPVQMAANGNQLLVTSGGFAYCDNGQGPVKCLFNVPVGGVTADGIDVTWEGDGDDFTDFTNVAVGGVIPGALITIAGTVYQVATVAPASSTGNFAQLTTTTPVIPGGHDLAYSGFGLDGIGSFIPNFPTPGISTYELEQGDPFDPSITGTLVTIFNGTEYVQYPATYVSPSRIAVPSVVVAYHVPYGADDPVAAGGCAFFDTYFIVFQPLSRQINISAIQDGTTWNGLDFAVKEGYPDNISAILVDHRQLWIFGDEIASEIWNDTGNALFPFQRNASGFIQYACLAPDSPVRLNNGVAWIGGDELRGGPIAWFASAFEPVRVSNHAVEAAWSSYATYQDAISFSYIESGHAFWVIDFPAADKTWVYDATASGQTGVAVWHERTYSVGAYPANVSHRQLQANHAYVAFEGAPDFLGGQTYPEHYVGDHSAVPAVIYNQGEYLLSDNGAPIVRIRTFPHIGTENLWTYFERFELAASVQSGVVNPWLDYSHNWGISFVNPQQLTSENPNVYAPRMIIRRLGRDRDRVFRETIVDVADFAIVDAYYDAEAGVD